MLPSSHSVFCNPTSPSPLPVALWLTSAMALEKAKFPDKTNESPLFALAVRMPPKIVLKMCGNLWSDGALREERGGGDSF